MSRRYHAPFWWWLLLTTNVIFAVAMVVMFAYHGTLIHCATALANLAVALGLWEIRPWI